MQLTINDLTWFGRTLDHNGIRYFDFSASGFEFSFYGTKAECKIISDSHLLGDEAKGVLGVYVSRPEDVKKSQNQKEIKNAYDKDLLYPQGFKKIVLENQENNIIVFESEKPQKVHIKVLLYFGFPEKVFLETAIRAVSSNWHSCRAKLFSK